MSSPEPAQTLEVSEKTVLTLKCYSSFIIKVIIWCFDNGNQLLGFSTDNISNTINVLINLKLQNTVVELSKTCLPPKFSVVEVSSAKKGKH